MNGDEEMYSKVKEVLRGLRIINTRGKAKIWKQGIRDYLLRTMH